MFEIIPLLLHQVRFG